MSTKTKPIIAIIGATGGQGSSVLNTFHSTGLYQIRAITRNPSSAKALALSARGIEVVQGDLNNLTSLTSAFKDASIIFAVTDFFEPFMASGPEKAMEVETQQGINLAKAAAATPTLKHYIWSTLPNGSQISGGKYKVPHFEAKNAIDAFILADEELSKKTTFLWVTWFASNTTFPLFKPTLLGTSGKHVLIQPSAPETKILSVGDQTANVGPFVRSIVEHPELTLPAKFVLATTDSTTSGELLKTWGEINGKETEFVKTDLETYNKLFPAWGKEMGVMMEFWEEFGERSWTREGTEIVTGEELGVNKSELKGLVKTLKEIDWSE